MLSFCSAMSKVVESREELDQSLSDVAFMRMYQMTRTQLNQVLPGTPLMNNQGGEIVRPKAGAVRMWRRRLVVYLSVGLFVGFSGVVMYGCYRILCRPGDEKCVKLC
ncbi:hypothetical protein BUALT_Bualt10G0059100 [Buddleja alternifolia]|uniref:Uncharacterized protein n=1 Tax=Buddleja alternifolia TaxID=168488 RepID=A0AAV6X533_9LAMI|nr:hypothetical protein BUALT_Bualt10G0059100 [Buddleja alternifolia]